MLIFEGPDGAGKTTLIEAFQEAFGLPVAPRVVSKDTNAMVDLQSWVDENLAAGFQQMIFDRHRLISETIYGPVLREQAQAGFNDIHWLAPRMNQFYRIRPIIIYCLPPIHTIRRNLAEDEDNASVKDHISKIYSAYVSRASIDMALAPGTIHIWDYINSPKARDGVHPVWFNEVKEEMKARSY